MDIASTSDTKQKKPMEVHVEINTEPPKPNLPCADLLGEKVKYRSICVPLYEASVSGNWEAAEKIMMGTPNVVRCSITENHETALHIAASAKSSKLMEDFVNKLVNKMTPEDLELQNKNNNTALCLAAAGGNVTIAKILVDRNNSLLNIPGSSMAMLPLYIASLYRRRDMVVYLYEKSNKMDGASWTHKNRVWVLLRCVEANYFDIAVKIVTIRPELSKSKQVLQALARKTDAFREIKPNFIWRVISAIIRIKVGPVEEQAMHLLNLTWTHIMTNLEKPEINDIIRGEGETELQYDEATKSHVRKTTYSSRVLFIAAEMGNTRFIVELIRLYPDLIWKLDDRKQTMFHVAVSHRQEGVYNLMYEIGSMKDFITPLKDIDGNNMLHLAAKGAKKKRLQETSGVALQMQRELLWYKEVEGMLPTSCQETKNKAGLLPHELFTNEHKYLMSASEKWMKDTASHCMVVAALIATVVFAAAFTVPGGYNNDTNKDNDKDYKKGMPILKNNAAFIVFVIADAVSLTFATISIFMFLYILTSRYAEKDFLESLPKKLMIGLAALFLSIASMMVAFSVSFFALYDDLLWVPVLITTLASIPVFLYAWLQYGLVAEVYDSTYGSKYLFKPKKPMLY